MTNKSEHDIEFIEQLTKELEDYAKPRGIILIVTDNDGCESTCFRFCKKYWIRTELGSTGIPVFYRRDIRWPDAVLTKDERSELVRIYVSRIIKDVEKTFNHYGEFFAGVKEKK